MKKHKFLEKNIPLLKELGVYTEFYENYINRTYSPHGVDVVLLSFIIRGQGVHVLEGEKYVEHGKSISVIHYDQEHDILTEGMDVINIFLDLRKMPLPHLPGTLNKVLPGVIPLHPNFHNKINKIVRLEFDDIEELKNIAMAIIKEQEEQAEGYNDVIFNYLRLFLILMCRQALKTGIEFASQEGDSSRFRLEKVRRYIEQNFTQNISLDKLANVAGLNKNYLCRAFKKYTGKSLITYQLERKIQNAMLALRSTDQKIFTIALENGFNDLAFFNKKFKEFIGTSPKNYRCNK